MNHRHAEQLPLVVLGTYALGYLAGRSIAALWSRGPTDAHGVRRLAAGAAGAAGVVSAGGAGVAPTRTRAA